jgi:hypothetical protein
MIPSRSLDTVRGLYTHTINAGHMSAIGAQFSDFVMKDQNFDCNDDMLTIVYN